MNQQRLCLPSGDWYLTTWKGATEWLGLAKHNAPFVNGHPLYEPGAVWFEFGATEAEALKKIKAHIQDVKVT